MGAQDGFVPTLAWNSDEELPDDMTKAEVPTKIDELLKRTGPAPKKQKAKMA